MAFTGSLEDLGIVDLMQFPYQGRRTGAVRVESGGRQARLYYRNGNLVHAVLDDTVGLEVVVELISWTAGQFEFQQGEETSETTIEADLHRTVMTALKIRDERRAEEEERRKQEEEKRRRAPDTVPTSEQLRRIAAGQDLFTWLCLLSAGSGPLAETGAETEGAGGLKESLAALARDYPRAGLRRLFIEDDGGTVAMAAAGDGCWLVAAAERGSPLGAAAMGLGRLLSRLAKGEV